MPSADDKTTRSYKPSDKDSPDDSEKPGLIKEVRRSFHRRIAEKLALNLSGMKQLLRDGSSAGFSVWNTKVLVFSPTKVQFNKLTT